MKGIGLLYRWSGVGVTPQQNSRRAESVELYKVFLWQRPTSRTMRPRRRRACGRTDEPASGLSDIEITEASRAQLSVVREDVGGWWSGVLRNIPVSGTSTSTSASRRLSIVPLSLAFIRFRESGHSIKPNTCTEYGSKTDRLVYQEKRFKIATLLKQMDRHPATSGTNEKATLLLPKYLQHFINLDQLWCPLNRILLINNIRWSYNHNIGMSSTLTSRTDTEFQSQLVDKVARTSTPTRNARGGFQVLTTK
ncbi:hypothetical protein CBL_11440 [Carabus blaptoides fortunei]